MDPGDAFSANIFKWDHHHHPYHQPPPPPPPPELAVEYTAGMVVGPRELGEVFDGYGVRYATVARMGELGFTASTLVGMTEAEVDDMMATLAHLFRWDLLLGERYGIKAALRAERRRLEALLLLHHHHQHQSGGEDARRRLLLLSPDHGHPNNALDALSQEGLSEEPVQQQDTEAAGSGGAAAAAGNKKKKKQGGSSANKQRNSGSKKTTTSNKKNKRAEEDGDDGEEEAGWGSGSDSSGDVGGGGGGGGSQQRQREHPFIVTEPGEVARAKKNGLDYLFHLYDQCRHFLLQVQALSKERGDKCPTKVTNQVFRYAKKVGASYINKPKMRHYVHCYALHCLDEEASNALRRAFKERGENVGAWRQACYKPLVSISARHGFDIDAVFNAHPRLSIWYVPTKLRQLCHLARSNATGTSSALAAGSNELQAPPPAAMF